MPNARAKHATAKPPISAKATMAATPPNPALPLASNALNEPR